MIIWDFPLVSTDNELFSSVDTWKIRLAVFCQNYLKILKKYPKLIEKQQIDYLYLSKLINFDLAKFTEPEELLVVEGI